MPRGRACRAHEPVSNWSIRYTGANEMYGGAQMALTDAIKRLRRVSQIGLMRASMIDGMKRNPVATPANVAAPEHQVSVPAAGAGGRQSNKATAAAAKANTAEALPVSPARHSSMVFSLR